ncbi:MAG TPA: alpha/beta hydrolase [Verrucomicrobiae bacterium]
MHKLAFLFVLIAAMQIGRAADLRLEDVPYPFPVKTYKLSTQQQDLEMSYMDVAPSGQSRGTILLLHGKNFNGAYWEETANALSAQGYRVIIPDQIGFGKSSKPNRYQYSFHQLAQNTHSLLTNLNVSEVHILGHSMGGMLAIRMALLYPESTKSLTLVNPIGLEDWQMKGVPYQTPDQWYQQEFKQTAEKIRTYQKENYYHGEWNPHYERWVEQAAATLRSPNYSTIAWNQALAYEMIYTQPVCHEFSRIKVPTLLIIGQKDRTAIGANLASADVRQTLGDYPKLGRATALKIPNSTLAELEGIGHVPHIENFGRFIEPLKTFLASK